MEIIQYKSLPCSDFNKISICHSSLILFLINDFLKYYYQEYKNTNTNIKIKIIRQTTNNKIKITKNK